MLRSISIAAIAALTFSSPAFAVTVNWIDWLDGSTDSTGTFTATGQITSGSETIDVTYTNPQGVSFIQTGSGTNFFTPNDADNSPYTSTGPNGNDNIPTPSEMIALRFQGTQSLSFSTPVANLYLAFVSLNRNGYTFDQDFDILSQTGANIDGNGVDSAGFWGTGQVVKVDNGDGTFSIDNPAAGEPHGTLFFLDEFTSLTWDSDSNENWNGFTVGVEGTAAQVNPDPVQPATVPLPASSLLLLGALGGLAAMRRKS